MRISEYDISSLGLCVAIWRVWNSPAPSPIPRMDWRTRVGWSVGDGTGEVVTFVDSESGYGCGYPSASGRLFDADEYGRPGSVCPLAAGHGVKNSGAGPRLPWFSVRGSGSGCPGTQGSPRFHSDGGDGSVVTLIGSGYDAIGHLAVYGQPFLGLTLHWICNNLDYRPSWPGFCMSHG